MFEKRLKKLKDVLKIQCNDGNWNYSNYMFGFANALILACELLEDILKKFRINYILDTNGYIEEMKVIKQEK